MPLFAALFTLVLVQKETAPVVAVAVLVSSLLVAYLALRNAHQEGQDETAAENRSGSNPGGVNRQDG